MAYGLYNFGLDSSAAADGNDKAEYLHPLIQPIFDILHHLSAIDFI